MNKVVSLGLTGRKLLAQGLVLIILGLLLMVTGTWLPEMTIRWVVYILLLSSIFDLLMRFFKKSRSTDNLLVALLKIALLFFLAGADMTIQIPIYLFSFLMGLYQLFIAFVNGVTYILYLKNHIRPRWRFFFDGIWMAVIGGMTLFSSTAQSHFQAIILGGYLVLYGSTILRDGLFFEQELANDSLKRRIRVSLPLILAAIIPSATLKRINDFLQGDKSEEVLEEVALTREPLPTELEIFVHVANKGFGVLGHVDLSYKGKVYGYGSYDVTSERLFGAVGDGVLFTAEQEAYIDFCNQEGVTLFAYKINLDDQQKVAIEEQLSYLESLLLPWSPSSEKLSKDEKGQDIEMYAYRMQKTIGASLFKFKKSKFKTYFVMSTNCVLLADSILGKAGTDILNPKGFIAPGTYQLYLDEEFERPHSIVVAKNIYPSIEKD